MAHTLSRRQTIPGIYDEFWTASIRAMGTEVAYVGPMPTRPRDYYALGGGFSNQVSFVYFLRSWAEDLLYVGMSHNPGNRFDKHRRRSWWPEVSQLTLLRVCGDDKHEAQLAARFVEGRAIRRLDPIYNIAGVPV